MSTAIRGSSNEDKANLWLDELERIRLGAGGVLLTESVVDAARNPLSPLHDEFEWDDKKAAHAHRLDTARHIIRSVELVIERRPDLPPLRVPAFTNLSMIDKETLARSRGYMRTDELLQDPERRATVLRTAMDEATRWASRYKHLEELSAIVSVIDGAKAA